VAAIMRAVDQLSDSFGIDCQLLVGAAVVAAIMRSVDQLSDSFGIDCQLLVGAAVVAAIMRSSINSLILVELISTYLLELQWWLQ
jgi:hypothetical protein